MGSYFLKGLAELRDQYEIVGDVRGKVNHNLFIHISNKLNCLLVSISKGLMIGVELVGDKEERSPLNSEQFIDIWEQCKEIGVLFGKGGLYGNVLRIKPPMCITKKDVDFALDTFKIALDAHKIKYL